MIWRSARKQKQQPPEETLNPVPPVVIPSDPEALTRIEPASIAADSHRGLVRRNNEDSFFYALNADGSRLIAAVADGIGGNENGEIASRTVCKMLLLRWRALNRKIPAFSSYEAADFLTHTIEEINSALFRINESYGTKPMGTTIATLILGDTWMVSAHCGDSRLYRLRSGELTCMTADHSLVNEMILNGELTQEEAKSHPFAHVITRSIGPAAQANPEIHIADRCIGDRYLLCSDGVSRQLSEQEIKQILSSSSAPEQKAKDLIAASLKHGGTDNATAIVIAFGELPEITPDVREEEAETPDPPDGEEVDDVTPPTE